MSAAAAELAGAQREAPAVTDAERVTPRTAQRAVVVVVLLGLILAGAWLRFANLGALTAQVDEGFQALAVQGILEHGYPKLDSGYVYGRSPVFLYAQALSAKLFGLSEWSLRLPAAVFGVLGIPAAYWLGRELFAGVTASRSDTATQKAQRTASQLQSFFASAVGLVLAAMFAVSAWEIEYARYGRFYTLFQFFYMLGVVAFVRGYLRGGNTSKIAFWLLFLLTVSVHDLGVMLGLCFWAVIPLRGYTWKRKSAYFGASVLCGALWIGYTRLWRGVAAAWSEVQPDTNNTGLAVVAPTGDSFLSVWLAKLASMLPGLNLPDLRLLEMVWAQRPWVLGLIALPGVAATVMLSAVKLRELSDKREQRRKQNGTKPPAGSGATRPGDESPAVRGRLWLPLLLTAVWAATLQQFALAGVALLVYAAFFVRSWRHWLRRAELVTLASCGVAMTLWVLYFWSSDSVSKHVWVPAVTNLPALHHYFLQWFVPGWTRMLVLLLPAAYVVARLAARGAKRDGEANGAWLLLVAVAAPILVTSELKWQFSESRYFFHLYPLILAALAAGVVAVGVWLARRVSDSRGAAAVVTALLLAGVSAVTVDLNPAEAYAVTQRTHQSAKDPIRSVINFPFYAGWAQDQKTATLAAADQVKPEDRVLVVGPVHIAANYRYYLGRVDHIASTLPMYNTSKRDRHGRWIDLVTMGEVVHTAERLAEIAAEVEAAGVTLWVFSDTVMAAPENWYLSDAEPALKDGIAALTADAAMTGKDGKTVVAAVYRPALVLSEALPLSDLASDGLTPEATDTSEEQVVSGASAS